MCRKTFLDTNIQTYNHTNMFDNEFQNLLKDKIDEYIESVYGLTKNFPKEEIYCITTQLRRSAISVMLNYIEGYARQSSKTFKNFLKISYGSLKESQYLIKLGYKQNYIIKEDYNKLNYLSDEIAKMLWAIITRIK